MSNQLEMVKKTRSSAKRLYTYEEISELIAGDKRTERWQKPVGHTTTLTGLQFILIIQYWKNLFCHIRIDNV